MYSTEKNRVKENVQHRDSSEKTLFFQTDKLRPSTAKSRQEGQIAIFDVHWRSPTRCFDLRSLLNRTIVKLEGAAPRSPLRDSRIPLHSAAVQVLLRLVVPLAVAATILGCGEEERGETPIGEPCAEDRECRHGYCVAGAAGDDAVCTRSCGATADCPRGWACSGLTGDNVLVCTRGAPTPFGFGANE